MFINMTSNGSAFIRFWLARAASSELSTSLSFLEPSCYKNIHCKWDVCQDNHDKPEICKLLMPRPVYLMQFGQRIFSSISLWISPYLFACIDQSENMHTLFCLWAVLHLFLTTELRHYKTISFMLFNELLRFLSEIETDNLTISNSKIITLDFTVWKIAISWSSLIYLLI